MSEAEWVNALLAGLKEQLTVQAVIFFGSRVRGDEHEWSDFDLVVIADFASPRIAVRREAVMQACPQIKLDAFCYTPAEFDEVFHQYVQREHDTPPLLGSGIAAKSEAEVVMYAVADGICLFGENFLEPYYALHARYVREGLVQPVPRYSPLLDVRDGLTTIQRRLLYTLWRHFSDDVQFPKCSRIIDCCRELYHPFGAIRIHNELVQMAQWFRSRYPLIIGRGNFGTIYSDPPSAPRYSEAALSLMVQELMGEVVEWVPNYRNNLSEPTYLSFRYPNLLANGSMGARIAHRGIVPPYNLCEICDGLLALLDNPQLGFDELIQLVPGPDFPTGGQLLNPQSVREVMKSGTGDLVVRGTVELHERDGQRQLVISEIPYTVSLAAVVQQIQTAFQKRSVPALVEFVDATIRVTDIRLELCVEQDADAAQTVRELFAQTDLETSIAVDAMVIDVDGTERRHSLLELMQSYLNTRSRELRLSTSVDADAATRRLRDEILHAKNFFGDARRTSLVQES